MPINVGSTEHIIRIIFKSLDPLTHEKALFISQTATRNDRQTIISSFVTLQNSCLAYHQSFRTPFMEYFYGPH